LVIRGLREKLVKAIVPRVARVVNRRERSPPQLEGGSGFDYAEALMTCEVFIPLNDIATEGYECGRPGEYDERLEMVVCEEHKTELVQFNAGYPKGIAVSTRRRLSGAA
jgi:hypothetical protein